MGGGGGVSYKNHNLYFNKHIKLHCKILLTLAICFTHLTEVTIAIAGPAEEDTFICQLLQMQSQYLSLKHQCRVGVERRCHTLPSNRWGDASSAVGLVTSNKRQ